MARIIAITNSKGGVGKSATAINLSASLAHFSRKTLLIDMDPQGNSSKGLGINTSTLDNSIYEVLKYEIDINESILNTPMEGMKIIPSKLTLANLDSFIDSNSSINLLKNVISKLNEEFDYIIIDCPPSMSFITENCLTAANSVLIPVQCEPFALDATTQILSKIIKIQSEINKELEIEGFLLTMFDSKLNLCNEIVSEVKQLFKENTFATPIPRTVSVPESNMKGLPVCLFRPTSTATIAFFSLAREIMDKE